LFYMDMVSSYESQIKLHLCTGLVRIVKIKMPLGRIYITEL